MKYIYLLSIIIFFSNCTEHKYENDYLLRELHNIDKRIDFIRYSLNQSKKENPESRRYLNIIYSTESIDEIFIQIENKLIKGDLINEEIESVFEIINRTKYAIDFNNNAIDDLIQYKFRNDIKELEKLNKNTLNNLSRQEITHALKVVHESFMNTYFTLSRTDKYTFEKVEIFPYSFNEGGLKIRQGDTLTVGLLAAAYDSIDMPQIRYWNKEESENKKTQNGGLALELYGAIGKHSIEGEYILKANNREDTLNFEFSYIVE